MKGQSAVRPTERAEDPPVGPQSSSPAVVTLDARDYKRGGERPVELCGVSLYHTISNLEVKFHVTLVCTLLAGHEITKLGHYDDAFLIWFGSPSQVLTDIFDEKPPTLRRWYPGEVAV